MSSRIMKLEAFAIHYIEDAGYTAEDVDGCMLVRAASVVSDLTEDELAQAVRDYSAKHAKDRK